MLLRLVGAVPIVAGLASVAFGAAIVPGAEDAGPSAGSELRFYGAWWVGAGVFLLAVVIALAGMDAWNFRIALTLNGLGWNFLFVGATTLVTTTYRPSERGRAQALNDFLVFGTTATCSLLAGFLQNRLGWLPLNWLSVVLVGVAILAVGWLKLRHRRPALA